MFTGLIEEIGTISRMIRGAKSSQMVISAEKVIEDIKIGDSISTNGICLTVISFTSDSFTVDVMPETLRQSSLGQMNPGGKVNIERAMRLGDRMGGHIVSGHIDGIGVIKSIIEEDNATWLTIESAPEIMKYIINKGSIAIDGTSLTVAYVDDREFKVSIIPLTKDETTLLKKRSGDQVNLECDMVGKYIERLMTFDHMKSSEKPVDLKFLIENGFA